ncbi:L-lactate permease [Pseudactinotalea sp. Z1739]|uniref:L-lactate permease n=1 Tax=Pseudactinotalea sp. Z1739 TaxID=3413028 RepID=UPI003C7ABE40
MTELILALAPFAVVLGMLAVRIPALWAGVAGLAVALLGGSTVFAPTGEAVAATAAQMGPTVLAVALIILGGLGLAEAMARSGGQDAIADWLDRAEAGQDRTVSLLLLVYGLTPFLEAVTGFGIGLVISAPLLIRHGLAPVRAVTVGLLGMVTAPWGSLAPGMLVASRLGGVDFADLGVWSALLSLPVLVVSMVGVLALAGGRVGARRVVLAAVVVALQWAGLIGASLLVGPPLTGVLTALVVIVVLLVLTRISYGPLPAITTRLRRGVRPYLLLVGGILVTTAALAIAGDPAGLAWLSSPALWLVASAMLAPVLLGIPRVERPAMAIQVLRRWLRPGGTAVMFLALGIVMAVTGMADYLAVTAAQMGIGFLATIPAIGALGGYLTGSNTGSAAMFSTATTTAALGLDTSPIVPLAAQNVAASFGMNASPARIALATAVALPAGERFPARYVAVLAGAITVAVAILGAATLLIG